jgi:hypothetical protein
MGAHPKISKVKKDLLFAYWPVDQVGFTVEGNDARRDGSRGRYGHDGMLPSDPFGHSLAVP